MLGLINEMRSNLKEREDVSILRGFRLVICQEGMIVEIMFDYKLDKQCKFGVCILSLVCFKVKFE